ncbi:glycine cleavage system aminomethyltransferase GcvT [Halorubrum sp. Eb13]|uniref:glycine cleavage system aminomethyltransferase GcvT n=1 Tax=Halorubrum sp. Eb13 TaxID=1383843 RepID=UPI000B98FFB0|nr:glycine cleavage system aminomethyltransferase GcvT [Halorubrum sp. Eb13]OYR48410.1 glycine cleavage system protein T [Halorubrum sp. Eb13]
MTDRLPPLHETHEARGAKFTDFGGWQMPVEFGSIREEHAAVRESVGVFDVSHMSEVEVSGPDATALMNRLTTNDAAALDPGDSQYAAITDEEGVMLDDTVVYRLPDGIEAGTGADALAGMDRDLDAAAGDPAYLFVPNAGHDDQMTDRWTEYRDEAGLDATVANVTDDWAMLAVQGPDAADAVDDATPADRVVGLPKFEATVAAVAGADSWVARTGYTGEDGFEILCPTDAVEDVWSAFAGEGGAEPAAQPCGLGARDTLRTEMGYLLSGQDFDPDDEPRTPYEARIGFVVKLDTEFVGRDALERQKAEGVDERFVGVRLLERGVPRGGYAVTDGDLTRIGHLTSGTMSPTLDEPIGLGYLHESYVEPGAEVSVVVRGDEKRAEIVIPPFLDR